MADLKFNVRNRMTIAELKAKNDNSNIEFYRKSNGKCFFMCGETVGYVHSSVAVDIASGELGPNDLQFAECQREDQNIWVPTIMRAGATLLGTL